MPQQAARAAVVRSSPERPGALAAGARQPGRDPHASEISTPEPVHIDALPDPRDVAAGPMLPERPAVTAPVVGGDRRGFPGPAREPQRVPRPSEPLRVPHLGLPPRPARVDHGPHAGPATDLVEPGPRPVDQASAGEIAARLEVEDGDDVAGPDPGDPEEVIGLDPGIPSVPVRTSEVVRGNHEAGTERTTPVPGVLRVHPVSPLRRLHDGEGLAGCSNASPPNHVVPLGHVHPVKPRRRGSPSRRWRGVGVCRHSGNGNGNGSGSERIDPTRAEDLRDGGDAIPIAGPPRASGGGKGANGERHPDDHEQSDGHEPCNDRHCETTFGERSEASMKQLWIPPRETAGQISRAGVVLSSNSREFPTVRPVPQPCG
jgi:hypothetical protein